MIRTYIVFALCMGCAIGAVAGQAKDKPIDYAAVERKIVKEPKYTAKPLYALFLLGPSDKFRVWAVLDKSKRGISYYDTLFLDVNGNGDLTDPGERFTGKYEPHKKSMVIQAGNIRVPGSKLHHSYFTFLTAKDQKGAYFSIKWDRKIEVSGGHSLVGGNYTTYADSAESAPVLHPTPGGPLGFALLEFGGDCEEVLTAKKERVVRIPKLKIGRDTSIRVLIGNPGSGPDTLCAVWDEAFSYGEDVTKVTLIAKDQKKREVRTTSSIPGPC